MIDLTPDEVTVGRRNLLAELKEIERLPRNNQGLFEISDRTLADLIALLEALKPVVGREVTDEDVEDFCREAWAQFTHWDNRAQAVHRRTARRALEMPLSQPVVVDREVPSLGEIAAALASCAPRNQIDEWPERYRMRQAAAVLAALYPKTTEGREEIGPHDPTGVLPTDVGVFVECACGKNPTPKYWIEDHWTGERSEGERRVRALLAEHLPAARHPKATEGES